MTRAEALKEARRRWGPDARAYPATTLQPEGIPLRNAVGSSYCLSGWGDSFEEAFADADRRASGGDR